MSPVLKKRDGAIAVTQCRVGSGCAAALTVALTQRMRASRLESDAIAEYMVLMGVAKRTAQLHRQKQDPKWEEFYRLRGMGRGNGKEKRRSVNDGELRVPEGMDLEGKTTEEAMELSAKETWDAIDRLKRDAINAESVAGLPNLCKAESEAQKTYREAKRALDSRRVADGQLVERGELDRLKQMLQSLKQVMDSMPDELGPLANPSDHVFGKGACKEWLRGRFLPQFQNALKQVKSTV